MFIAIGSVQFSYGQYNVDNQSQPEIGTQVHDACQVVNLLPGYNYTATYGSSMKSYINPPGSICDVNYSSGGAGFTGTGGEIPPALDYNKSVGTTNGSFDVNSLGEATYTIPLTVPPGTMGAVPQLSINYNSDGGNGLLGIGWSVGGLYTITRAPQDVYDDGQISPITLTNNDRFSLNGSRLLLTPGSASYGTAGATYHTENESFQLITSVGQANGGPSYFTVQTKDGHILEFGNTTDSKILASGSSNILNWCLNRISDSRGNYIDFHYIQDGTGEFRPDYIEYTGNSVTGQIPYNKIQFVYSTRADLQESFIAGSTIPLTLLLTSIQMYTQGGVFTHEYTLTYTNDELYSHLSEIAEYGYDYSNYNTTKINWHNNLVQPITNSSILHFPGLSFIGHDNKGLDAFSLLTGDIDGDGRTDLLQIMPSPDDGTSQVNWSNYLSENEYGGTYEIPAPIDFYPNKNSNSAIAGDISTNWYGTWGYYNGADNNNWNSDYIDDQFHPTYGFTTSMPLMDMNGDGKSDMILYNQSGGFDYFDFYINNNGDFNTTPFHIKGPLSVTGSPFVTAVGDFDGDGLQDLVVYYQQYQQIVLFKYNNQTSQIEEYSMDGTWQDANETQVPESLKMMYNIYGIDIDGDGRSELMIPGFYGVYILRLNAITGTNVSRINYFNNANFGSSPTYPLGADGGTINNFPCSSSVYVGDFNGDGKSDILIYNNFGNYDHNYYYGTNGCSTCRNNWYIGYSNGSNEFNLYSAGNILPDNGPAYGYQFTPNFQYSSHEYYVADFNGDGKSDIVDEEFVIDPGGSTTTINLQPYPNYSKLDLGVYFSTGNVNAVSNGTLGGGFTYHNVSYTDGTMGPLNRTLVGDFNGDGHADLIYNILWAPGNYYNKLINFDLNNQTDGGVDKVTAISNGLNVTTNIFYAALPNMATSYPLASKYTEGTITPPIFVENIQWPLYVTEHVEQDNGIGSQNETDFSYGGGQFHLQGKGFLGYTSMTSLDVTTQHQTENYYTLSETGAPNGYYFDMLLNETKTSFLTAINPLVDDKTYSYTTINTPTGITSGSLIHYNYTSGITDNNALQGIQNTTTISQDQYGNDLSESVSNSIQTTTITNTFGASANEWIPANLLSRTINIHRTVGGVSDYTRNFTYGYNSSGQLIENDEPSLPLFKSYTYDDNTTNLGNLISTTISGGGLTSRTSTLGYDALGRFVISKTNPLNQTEYCTYDNIYGNITNTTDINGLITSYTYDGLGRLTKTITPTGQAISVSRSWDNSGLSNSLFYISTTESGAPTNVVYSDKLGENLRTQTSGFGGNNINVDNTYLADGQIATKSNPYFPGSESPIVATYSYDAYERPYTITGPPISSGASYIITYTLPYGVNSYTSVFTSPNSTKTVTKNYDASGLVTSVIEDGADLFYTYASCDKPISVTGNGTTTKTYDPYGRCASINNQDAGLKTYYYDELGELLYQQSANQNAVTSQYYYYYDKLGRLGTVTEGVSGESLSYVYDNQLNGKGKLGTATSTINSNTVTCNYNFDNQSRLQSRTENINGINYTSTFQYNTLNQVTQMTYPSSTNFTINKNYDNWGYLTSITSNSTQANPIWQCNNMTDRNMVQDALQGNTSNPTSVNQAVITRSYDAMGLLHENSITETNNNNPITAEDITYNFNDGNGNLDERTNNISNPNPIAESFSYDNLDRLLSVSFSPTGTGSPLSMNYSTGGNITFKSDVCESGGEYQYSNQPHAVTAIVNPSAIAPNVPQTVTYTPFDKVSTILEGPDANGDAYKLAYTYGPDHERKTSQVQFDNVPQKDIVYAGEYESITNDISGITYGVSYIHADGEGLIAMNVTQGGADYLYFVNRDHLGSITSIFPAQNYSAIPNVYSAPYYQSFDAWGNYRIPASWIYTSSSNWIATNPAPDWLIRGFTGHEQLPQFGLINMNGRMYDPLIARILSPDPLLQCSEYSQNYNRYSYCFNNPLKFKDPTGKYIGWDDAGACLIGGIGNLYANWGEVNGFWNAASYFANGALAGEATLYGGPGATALILGVGNQLIHNLNNNDGDLLKTFDKPFLVPALENSIVNYIGGKMTSSLLYINGTSIKSQVLASVTGSALSSSMNPSIANLNNYTRGEKMSYPTFSSWASKTVEESVTGFGVGMINSFSVSSNSLNTNSSSSTGDNNTSETTTASATSQETGSITDDQGGMNMSWTVETPETELSIPTNSDVPDDGGLTLSDMVGTPATVVPLFGPEININPWGDGQFGGGSAR